MLTLRETLRFPFRDPKWPIKLLIGTGLLWLSSLILPVILVYGYQAELLRRLVQEGDVTSLPEWFRNFERNLIDGLVFYLVQFLLQLLAQLPLLPLYVLVSFVSIVAGTSTSTQNGDLSALSGLIALLVGCSVIASLLAIALFLVLFPFAMVLQIQFTERSDFADLIAFRRAWQVIRTDLAAFRRALGYYIVTALLSVAVCLLLLCTIVGILLLPAVGFYLLLTSAYAFAQAYRHGQALRAGTAASPIPVP